MGTTDVPATDTDAAARAAAAAEAGGPLCLEAMRRESAVGATSADAASAAGAPSGRRPRDRGRRTLEDAARVLAFRHSGSRSGSESGTRRRSGSTSGSGGGRGATRCAADDHVG